VQDHPGDRVNTANTSNWPTASGRASAAIGGDRANNGACSRRDWICGSPRGRNSPGRPDHCFIHREPRQRRIGLSKRSPRPTTGPMFGDHSSQADCSTSTHRNLCIQPLDGTDTKASTGASGSSSTAPNGFHSANAALGLIIPTLGPHRPRPAARANNTRRSLKRPTIMPGGPGSGPPDDIEPLGDQHPIAANLRRQLDILTTVGAARPSSLPLRRQCPDLVFSSGWSSERQRFSDSSGHFQSPASAIGDSWSRSDRRHELSECTAFKVLGSQG